MEHPEEKHLVIRVDASTQIGTGHLMRCLALAQAWKDAGGQVTFIYPQLCWYLLLPRAPLQLLVGVTQKLY